MKSDWESAVLRMAQMPSFGKTIAPKRIDAPAMIQWFRERAPERLEYADRSQLPAEPPPLRRVLVPFPQAKDPPFVSQVQWLAGKHAEDSRLFVCDMRSGWISELRIGSESPVLKLFSDKIPNAVRVHPVDLNGDGEQEFLVANLGSFVAMDHYLGSVDRLRPKSSGWERSTLSDNLGRIADVKSFDFDADGDLDIAVAEFGWRLTGHVLLLENTTPKSQTSREPTFVTKTLDERHGAVQVEIADIDLNGRPDILALIAQEHETFVAYLGQPDGSFLKQDLFRAPHPIWGYSGFQMLDFDGDKDLDVLLTNGDMMDGPTIKPYHRVAWLENQGDLKFAEHVLAELPGVHRAEAADLDGDGDFDIVACALVNKTTEQQAALQKNHVPPASIWLEQTSPGQFAFHVWSHGRGNYPALTTGDFNGDGKSDVAFGFAEWDKSTTDTQPAHLELWLSGPAP